jgi:hypothetical protein
MPISLRNVSTISQDLLEGIKNKLITLNETNIVLNSNVNQSTDLSQINETNLTDLQNSIGIMDGRLTTIRETDLPDLTTQIGTVDTKVNTISTDVGTLDTKVSTIDTNLGALDTKVGTLDTKVNTIDTDLATVKSFINTTTHTGTVIESVATTPPEGYLSAAGQTVLVQDYPALYKALSGDEASNRDAEATFTIPLIEDQSLVRKVDASKVYVGDTNGNLYELDANDLEGSMSRNEKYYYKGHSNRVDAIMVRDEVDLDDGQTKPFIYSGSADNTIHRSKILVDGSFAQVSIYSGHSNYIYSIVVRDEVDPEDNETKPFVYSGSQDHTIHRSKILVDGSFAQVSTYSGHNDQVWSIVVRDEVDPDDNETKPFVYSGSRDYTIHRSKI